MSLAELLAIIKEEAMGTRVCVVEDDKSVLKVVMRIVEDGGYECVGCRDGLEFKHTLIVEGNIGLVITDLMMPNCDGIEVIETLLKYGIPCMVMTAAEHTDDIYIEAQLLRVPIIDKPIDSDELLKKVAEAFK